MTAMMPQHWGAEALSEAGVPEGLLPEAAALIAGPCALPEAPLAMPRQILERPKGFWLGLRAAPRPDAAASGSGN